MRSTYIPSCFLVVRRGKKENHAIIFFADAAMGCYVFVECAAILNGDTLLIAANFQKDTAPVKKEIIRSANVEGSGVTTRSVAVFPATPERVIPVLSIAGKTIVTNPGYVKLGSNGLILTIARSIIPVLFPAPNVIPGNGIPLTNDATKGSKGTGPPDSSNVIAWLVLFVIEPVNMATAKVEFCTVIVWFWSPL